MAVLAVGRAVGIIGFGRVGAGGPDAVEVELVVGVVADGLAVGLARVVVVLAGVVAQVGDGGLG